MFKTETTYTDVNRDGNVDETSTVVSEIVDGRVISKVETSANTMEPHSSISSVFYTYDELGRISHEDNVYDFLGTGSLDITSTIDRTFDENGRVLTELLSDSDGRYANLTTNQYSEFGFITEKLETFSSDGSTNSTDYKLEQWTYKEDGQTLASHLIDDFSTFDCIITDTYNYNKVGMLSTIKQQNEIRFGEERPHTITSFTWNPDGSMKTSTEWAGYTDEGYFQRKDTAYTWGDHYDSQKITYDLQGDWDPEVMKKVEHWYNQSGQLTHTLVSKDMDGNGGVLAGGFDSRDLTVATWVGDEKIAEYTDIGIDGIIESSFTSVISEALLS